MSIKYKKVDTEKFAVEDYKRNYCVVIRPDLEPSVE